MDKVIYYVDQLDKGSSQIIMIINVFFMMNFSYFDPWFLCVCVELAKFPLFVAIDKQVGVPKAKSYSVLGAFGLYLLLIVFNFAGSLLTNLLGFLYPAYASFRAIESPSKQDDMQWLTYWTVFGFLNTVEYFSDILLYWLPFYYLIKASVIVYMILPHFRGAEFLYQHFFRPLLLQQSSSTGTATGIHKRKPSVNNSSPLSEKDE